MLTDVNTVRSAFGQLSKEDQMVLRRYFDDGDTLEDIGKALGNTTRQWAFQFKRRALERAWDIAVGRKCFKCRKMYKLAPRAAGRPITKCPRCGDPMDTVPGRDLDVRPASRDAWAS